MGEVFAGRYELIDLIGQGGMGSVWRVWDAREERIVAAKVLRQSDAVSLLRFVREQALRVQHPHVLTPLGWAGEDDRVLFTMPVVAGGSVATLVGDHGALPAPYAAELTRQLLSALAAVHAAGILHRDVKPANLLLAATGRERPYALLTDFGIAIDLDGPRFTQTGFVTGTPGYLAPEAVAGVEPDVRSDLYAVGQVLKVMLTGLRPADLTSQAPAGVPSGIWELALALTAPAPDDRPATALAALAEVSRCGLPWTATSAGDVEVFRQVAAAPPGTAQLEAPDESAARVDDDATVARPRRADTSSRSGSGAAAGPDGDRPSRPAAVRAAVAAAVVTVVVVAAAAVALWRPWQDPGTAEVPTTGRTSTGAGPTSSASSPRTSPTTPSAAPTAARTSGTVRVGPVITRVGQPCEFSDVGLVETTIDGARVVCTRQPSGAYMWQAAPA